MRLEPNTMYGNMTTKQAEEAGISGIRFNDLTKEFELWVNGSIAKRVSQSAGQAGLHKAYEEVFGWVPQA